MEKCGFFNAKLIDGVYDRVYEAQDFADYFSRLISNGVFINPLDGLMVMADNALSVTVKVGAAFIDGFWYVSTEPIKLTIPPNATQLARQDKVVCKLDIIGRVINIEYQAGAQSLLPVNDGNVHELVLATIDVGVGASVITNANITDRRPFEQYCGYVRTINETLTTGDLFKQFDTTFELWFNNVKDQLSEDAAGNLQNEINEIKGQIGSTEQLESDVSSLQTDVANLKAKQYKYVLATMASGTWSAEAKTYSFESTYPFATYDIEIQPDSTCNDSQIKAWSNAQIVGSYSSNVAKAYGDVPQIDIPIIIKVTKK